MAQGYLLLESKSLCVKTPNEQDMFAMKEIDVKDLIRTFKKASRPLVVFCEAHHLSFDDNTFNFVFSNSEQLERSSQLLDFANKIARTLKPQGFVVVRISAKDTYSFNSFPALFNCCSLLRNHDIASFNLSSMPHVHEMELKKINKQGNRQGKGMTCHVARKTYLTSPPHNRGTGQRNPQRGKEKDCLPCP